MDTNKNTALKENEYRQFWANLKYSVRQTQLRTTLASSKLLVDFYWILGIDIVRLEKSTHLGGKLFDRLSAVSRLEYLVLKGVSRRTLYAIRCVFMLFSALYFLFSREL